jgi:hypothetical protein
MAYVQGVNGNPNRFLVNLLTGGLQDAARLISGQLQIVEGVDFGTIILPTRRAWSSRGIKQSRRIPLVGSLPPGFPVGSCGFFEEVLD